MAALFGPSEDDLERLRSTVRSLGTTSVPGLAAALSWRARKAEKLLAHELARPNSPLVYEPSRRVVRWGPSIPTSPPAASSTAPVSSSSALPMRAPRAPGPVLTSGGLKTLCPHCHVPLLATGSTNLAVCPQCGRLASPRTAGVAPTESPPAREAPVPSPPPRDASREGARTLSLTDRNAQELFAAYVTSRPIPCPKCRTPLRHRSVSEYGCPSCGQLVRFPPTSLPGAAAPAVALAPP